jgi:16S rRNA (guanine527-N7)-methyltransferase
VTVSRETWLDEPPDRVLPAAAEAFGLALSPGQARLMVDCFDEIQRWNRRLNLIGPGGARDLFVRHVVDSLIGAAFMAPRPRRLADLGAGAGLPGIILKIFFMEAEVVLVDSRAKKVDFIKHALRRLSLPGAKAVQARLPGEADRAPGLFDAVTARAVGDIAEIARAARPLMAAAGRLYCYKGPGYGAELADFERAGDSRWSVERVEVYTLPFLGESRAMVVLRFT